MKRLLIFIISLVAIDALADTCSGWAGVRAPVRYALSAHRILLLRDLDGDGAPDIIASGKHVDELAAFSILSNRGDGTFRAERLLARGGGAEVEDVAALH